MSKTIFTELPAPEAIDVAELYGKIEKSSLGMICVLGPTASGKTRYAVKLASELSALHGGSGPFCEIISADSRQVYRGMDIGTGKDLAEYGEVPYHLIDIADAGTQYNVFRFKEDFEAAVKRVLLLKESLGLLDENPVLYAEGDIEGEGTCRDDINLLGLLFAELHDRALAKILLDLAHSLHQGLHLQGFWIEIFFINFFLSHNLFSS